MIRGEAMKDSSIWRNIGEVAVQTGILALPVHSHAHPRFDARFPAGVLPALFV